MTSRDEAWLHAVLAASGGFLVAVLWFDLMFDVQVVGHAGELPDVVRTSIAQYYRRVTTDAHPMSRLVAAVMVVATLGSGWTARHRSRPALHVLALATSWGPIGLAALRVLPNAVRLGAMQDGPAAQSVLARAIFADHVFCLVAVVTFVTVEVVLVAGCRAPAVGRSDVS